MTGKLSLFIVDDDVGFVHAAAEIARIAGYDISVAGTLQQAKARAAQSTFDIALVDLSLPDGNGLDLLEHLDIGARTQVILITGNPTVESALKALHLPIVDYVVKPLHAHQFSALLERASSRARVPAPIVGETWHGLAGGTSVVQEIRRQIVRVAPTEASVFIHGESGVGKELVAGAIHAESGRSGGFVALNCGAVPAELLTSQLFGHERGSFTGASARHVGLFEQANGGTLFLDEITEMPIHLQVHLLRALETRQIRRVGGHEDISIDVRVVAATNRPHEEAMRQSRLREDLYYRLAEFPLHVPPLRERPEDILPLGALFLQRLNERYGTRREFTRDALDQLQQHSWPGNIRELKNAVQRAYILADGDEVDNLVPQESQARPLAETATTITFAIGTPMNEIERRMLFKTLAFYDNNKAKTARALGVTTKTIYNRLTAYESSGEVADEGPDDSLQSGNG